MSLGLVFTSNGVVVGVVIRGIERYDLVKIKPSRKQNTDSAYDSVAYTQAIFRRLRSIALSESQAEAEEQIKMTMFDSEPCDWLVLPRLLPPTLTIQFSRDHKRRSRKRNRKKWKRSDSSDPDSIELMTPLRTTLGHKVCYDSNYDSDSVASENQA